MGLNSVGGRSVATAATADNVGAAFWNPHSTKRIWVTEVAWCKTVTTVDNPGLIRISTRGTQTLTFTPDIDNAWERDVDHPSGAVLDATYSAQPTVQGPYLWRWNLPAAIGSGFIKSLSGPGTPGLCIPPGTGLAIATPVAVVLQPGDVSFTWLE